MHIGIQIGMQIGLGIGIRIGIGKRIWIGIGITGKNTNKDRDMNKG